MTSKAKKPWLSIIGFILAVIFPPLGLLILISELIVKKGLVPAKNLVIAGLFLGSGFLLVFCYGVWLFATGDTRNEAQKMVQPFLAQIQQAGGAKICDNGNSGGGLDNTQPWYRIYYTISDTSGLSGKIKSFATQFGYPLSVDEARILQLSGLPDKDGSTTLSSNGETLNLKTDYLVSTRDGKTLEITINRDAVVALGCSGLKVSDYDKKQATGDGKAIVEVHFTLPNREP